MAEAVFKHKVALAGLTEQIDADSAGTAQWRLGHRPHREVRKIMADHAIPCDHLARLITVADLGQFDYILTMDNDNLRSVTYLGKRKARLEPLLKYAPGCGYGEIPDPMDTGNFELVYDLVSKATDGLLGAIKAARSL
jgi:protein-tyrosine phosphatase